jgi:5-methylcytosine-specific restriction endonuclease McrA
MIKRNSGQRDRDRARIKATGAACHICGQTIDYTLDWLDPLSFVVDHVIPLAKGGQDALANKKAAHRRQTVSATARSGHGWSLPSSGEADRSTKQQVRPQATVSARVTYDITEQ